MIVKLSIQRYQILRCESSEDHSRYVRLSAGSGAPVAPQRYDPADDDNRYLAMPTDSHFEQVPEIYRGTTVMTWTFHRRGGAELILKMIQNLDDLMSQHPRNHGSLVFLSSTDIPKQKELWQ